MDDKEYDRQIFDKNRNCLIQGHGGVGKSYFINMNIYQYTSKK